MMMAGLFDFSIQRNGKSQYIVYLMEGRPKTGRSYWKGRVAQRYFPPSGQLSPLILDLANLYLKAECGKWGL